MRSGEDTLFLPTHEKSRIKHLLQPKQSSLHYDNDESPVEEKVGSKAAWRIQLKDRATKVMKS